MNTHSNFPPARAVPTANAYRQRQLGKHLHRKAIMHFVAMVAFACLLGVVFLGPIGVGAAGLLLAFAGGRYVMNRRRMDFLAEAPITLGESWVSKFRLKRSVYRIIMSYTFEGRTYSSQQDIAQADHAAVLRRDVSLYALIDRRDPGKMLGYRAGSVLPRWLKSRSEEEVACERVA